MMVKPLILARCSVRTVAGLVALGATGVKLGVFAGGLAAGFAVARLSATRKARAATGEGA